MKGRTILTAVTLVALAATPALGQQQHRHGQQADTTKEMMQGGMMQGGMMGMMQGGMMHDGMMGMMQGMRPQPGMLLAAADQLALTPEQTEQLTALKEEASGQHMAHMQAAMTAHKSAAEALQGDQADLDAYEEALRQAANHMVMAHVAMARTALEARDVLTSEQLEKLEGAMSMMRHMRGGMMGSGGMMGPGDSGSGHGGHH